MSLSRPRFFIPGLTNGARRVALPPEDAHHLRNVLRLRAGADVAIFNGAGCEWEARVATVAASEVTVELGDAIEPVPEPPVRVVLGIGVLKGDQMDTVVRDATMLGVHELAPLDTDHVAVPERAWRSPKATARWERIAIASARQCRRAVVPRIAPVTTFQEVIDARSRELIVIAVEPARAETPAVQGPLPRPASALVLVGPEGGWSEAEVTFAIRRGARPLSLGPRTLRAETTPIVLLSVLWSQWGW